MKLSSKRERVAIFITGDQNGLLDCFFAGFIHSALKSAGLNTSCNNKSENDSRLDHADDVFQFLSHNIDLHFLFLFGLHLYKMQTPKDWNLHITFFFYLYKKRYDMEIQAEKSFKFFKKNF